MKPVKKIKIILFPLSILLISSSPGCIDKKTDEEIAVKIYVEQMIAEELHSNNSDSLELQRKLIFEKYNTTEKEYENFLNDLKDDNKEWERFFRKANEYLGELKKSGVIN